MNVQETLKAVRGGLDLLKAATPLAATLGFPQVAVTAALVTKLADTLLDHVAKGAVILAENDEADLKAMLAEIQPLNDELARQVAAS